MSGGLSQSLVNEGGGARTPFSTAIAAGMILLVVLFCLTSLSALPQPVLAAVVLIAVAGLFKWSTLKNLWRSDRPEFVAAMAAFLGVLGSGLLRGVMIGAIISLVQLLRAASRPHVALLGRVPGTRRFSDRQRHPDNELVPGVLIFRPESGLVYFNIDHVCEIILRQINAGPTRQNSWCSTCPPRRGWICKVRMRSAGWRKKSSRLGVNFQAVEARSSVRDRLRKEGMDERLGGINHLSSVADVLEAFSQNQISPQRA